MKKWIHASSDSRYSAYSNVDKVLNELFGIRYVDYKNKSDYIETPYGLLMYDVSTKRNDPDKFALRILFDDSSFDRNAYFDLLEDCRNLEGVDISSTYPEGNSGYARSNPQINLVVKKVFPYNYELIKQIYNFIHDVSYEWIGDKGRVDGGGEYLNYIIVRYYFPAGLDESQIDLFLDNICQEVKEEFNEVKSCKIISAEYDYEYVPRREGEYSIRNEVRLKITFN